MTNTDKQALLAAVEELRDAAFNQTLPERSDIITVLTRLDELEKAKPAPRDLKRYAWCFSHGTMHEFFGEPWCTADWVPVAGKTMEDALNLKGYIWGTAEFLHHLPNQQQMLVLSIAAFRDAERRS